MGESISDQQLPLEIVDQLIVQERRPLRGIVNNSDLRSLKIPLKDRTNGR